MMKRNKITAVILSLVMSMSLMMPSVEVLADEASAPSETQKTETVETKEPKSTEKQTPKETKKQEPKETEKQEPKETEKQEPKETEKQEPKETEKQESAESDETQITETAGSDEKEPTESKDNADNPEESNETAVVEGNIPSQSVSTPKKNAVTGTCGDELTWTIEDGTLTISGSGKMSNYTFVSTGNATTPWNEYKDIISSVVFSGTITSIGDKAFYYCTSITSITIPNSVTSIGASAFEGCTSLTSVTIPNGVTSIGERAFQGCKSLASVIIPRGVTKIDNYVFMDCKSLTSITIPKSIKTIDYQAFCGCSSLASVTIPDSVTSIGRLAFCGCTSLKSIAIPNSVISISTEAFKECSSLASVTIPNSVTSIGSYAFSGCTSLTSITISEGLKTIGYKAFSGCTSLASIVIPNSVTSIGSYAFSGCTSLTSVILPDSRPIVEDYAFADCTRLTSVVLNQSTSKKAFPDYTDIVFYYYYDVKYSNSENGNVSGKLRSFCGDEVEFTVTPNSNYVIDKVTMTYADKNVEIIPDADGKYKYTMPDTDSATISATFKQIIASGCCGAEGNEEQISWQLDSTGLLTISGTGKMKDYVEAVSVPWYSNRGNIKDIIISKGVTSIGASAFSGCNVLENIIIPKSVTSIGNEAFSGCSSLKDVYYDGTEDDWKDITIGSSNEPLQNANIQYVAAFSITVNSGMSDLAKAAKGTTVTVTANDASLGKVFDKWIVVSGKVKLKNETQKTTTFTMPAENVEVTATYKDVEYTIKVNNGSATPATATAGTVITLTADAAPYGKAFDKWIVDSGTVSLSNASSSTTTFTMPAENVEVTATYKDVEYTIKVNNGSATPATATAGTVITLTADAAPSGKAFDKWIAVSGSVKFANSGLSSVTWFTMPAENVEVTATYKDVEYTIKVNNGSATPTTATAGTVITLTADAAPSGKIFDKWIVNSGTVSLSNASSSTTTFTMPAENVEVTATYKDVEYTIKVNNGSASPATASAGTVIVLTADAAPSGKAFDKWIVVSGTVKFTNSELSSVTTFTMPAGNVEITATYKTLPSGKFVVKVNSGFATPSISAPGLVVNVTANDAPDGTEFDKWEVVSGTVIFADASSATTSFVMPAGDVEITAKFKSSLSVKGKTATVKYSKVKKKNQTLAVSKVLTFVDKGQGQLTYAKVSGNSKILINKTTGAITVKKKLKKKTYTVKVKVQASGNESCNPSGWKTVTFKIKVK